MRKIHAKNYMQTKQNSEKKLAFKRTWTNKCRDIRIDCDKMSFWTTLPIADSFGLLQIYFTARTHLSVHNHIQIEREMKQRMTDNVTSSIWLFETRDKNTLPTYFISFFFLLLVLVWMCALFLCLIFFDLRFCFFFSFSFFFFLFLLLFLSSSHSIYFFLRFSHIVTLSNSLLFALLVVESHSVWCGLHAIKQI